MTRDLIVTALPYLLSLITILATVLTGNKHRLAWAISLGGQAGWLVYILAAEAWGFLPLTVALTGLYLRNHFKWKSERAAPDMRDAYAGAREDLADWKRRALTAEATLRNSHVTPHGPSCPCLDCVVAGIKGEPVTLGDYIGKAQAAEDAPFTIPPLIFSPSVVDMLELADSRPGCVIHHPEPRSIYMQAVDLINRAVLERKVLTISVESLEPLAMGNHRMVPEVRDAREMA